MGLFSSKKRTVVGTTVQRVVENDTLPNAVETGSIKAILKSGEIQEEIVESLTKSLGVRADRMYSYAEKNYPWGLPTGEFFQSTKGRDSLQAILDAAENTEVFIEYANFGPPNSLHIGWMQLVSLYGYNPETNELPVLSALKGSAVYLEDMAVVVPTNQLGSFRTGSLEQWGTSPKAGPTPNRPRASGLLSSLVDYTPVSTDSNATDDYLKVTVVWKAATVTYFDGELITYPKEVITIPINDALVTTSADYFHVKYVANGVTKYWLYRLGQGTYPQLDGLFSIGLETNGSYFPFLYFRFDKQKQNEDKTTDAYKASKRMAKYLGMDYDTITDAIDENPDIADVQQAFLMLGVPANTEDPLELRYLFDYFDRINGSVNNQEFAPGVDKKNFVSFDYKRQATVIQDKRFKMVLSYQEVFKQRLVGRKADVGSYFSSKGTKSFIYTVKNEATDELVDTAQNLHYHEFCFQRTKNVYEVVTVIGLQVLFYVEGDHMVTADEGDDILLIPIDRSITATYSVNDKEELYAKSLHYVFNSLQVIKIKWYQRGVFKTLLIIVAIVIAVYDGGATLGGLMGLQGAAAILATIVINLVIGELLQVAFKLFAKVFGEEFAMLVAIVALVTSAYQVYQSGSLKGAPWAQDLLTAANGLTQAALEVGYAELMEEQTAFLKLIEEQTKTLETANELLENKTALHPFVIFGEKPTDYYNRTVHSGNIGVLGIEAISKYTEIALTLPKLNDTLGEFV